MPDGHSHMREHKGKKDPDHLIRTHALSILDSPNFQKTNGFVQHGTTSCQMHCLAVARLSLRLAERFRLRHNPGSLIRGALLHDFFLYDWHVPQASKGLHGYTHPRAALTNAETEFDLNAVERDIILRHMFPLTIVPPRHIESWLVCIADKICSLEEIFRLRPDRRLADASLFRHLPDPRYPLSLRQ